jgi:hypothetical protein
LLHVHLLLHMGPELIRISRRHLEKAKTKKMKLCRPSLHGSTQSRVRCKTVDLLSLKR